LILRAPMPPQAGIAGDWIDTRTVAASGTPMLVRMHLPDGRD